MRRCIPGRDTHDTCASSSTLTLLTLDSFTFEQATTGGEVQTADAKVSRESYAKTCRLTSSSSSSSCLRCLHQQVMQLRRPHGHGSNEAGIVGSRSTYHNGNEIEAQSPPPAARKHSLPYSIIHARIETSSLSWTFTPLSLHTSRPQPTMYTSEERRSQK